MTEHLRRSEATEPAPEPPRGTALPLVEILRAIPDFAGMLDSVDHNTLRHIEPMLSYFGVPAGTTLFREGEAADDAYVLVSGRIGIFVGARARVGDMPLAQIGGGEIFGEMSLISGEPRSATVIALRDSDLVRVPRAAFGLIIQSSPEASLLLMRYLASRLRETSHLQTAAAKTETIAVVPLAGPAVDPWFGRALIEAFAEQQQAVVIDSVAVERLQRPDSAAGALELYVAEDAAGAWARRCIRQADRVIFVAEADTARRAADHPAIAYAAALHRAADLVLINSGADAAPASSAGLRDAFASENLMQVRRGNSEDVRRVARMALGRAIGLVLSGGGARGFAHVGVYRAFFEAGVPVDLVGGTSMGAMVGGLIALDLSPAAAADRLRALFVAKNPVNDYTFPIVALSRGRKLNRLLRQHYGDGIIEDLWKGFFCISANLSTGQAIVHDHGSLWRALRASGAIPGIVPPVVVDGEVLVDGGIMNNLPTEPMVARRRGLVVGVDVATGGSLYAAEGAIEERSTVWLLRHGRKQMPSILRILMRCGTVNSELQSVASRAAADVLIQPELAGIDMLSFQAFENAADLGYRAGLAALPKIKELLNRRGAVSTGGL